MVSIRLATPDDTERLIELRLALHHESGHLPPAAVAPLTEATRAYLLRALPTGEFLAWVAVAEGVIVAAGGLNLFQRAPSTGNLSGREAYLLNMYTVPESRGRGIATALAREIIDYARRQGMGRIWLHATEAGRAVYERLGFVAVAEAMELWLDESTV